MAFIHFAVFITLASCSLFRGPQKLHSADAERLLNSVRVTGEGRGRLTLGQNQYLFGVDSVLKENQDWILAVAIPLHGEEVMIFPDLRQTQIHGEEIESFEQRIGNEFRRLKLKSDVTGQEFLRGLRSLIRFSLAQSIGLPRRCYSYQDHLNCDLGGEKFIVTVIGDELTIEKSLGEGKNLRLVAKNLTDSFFHQNAILFSAADSRNDKGPASVSLELFW